MKKRLEILSVLCCAIIITVLFHKQSIGINLFILETILVLWLVFTKQIKFAHRNQIICSAGLFITSIFTVITNSNFAIIINYLSLFLFIGILIYPEVKSLVNTFRLSANTIYYSQFRFVRELSGANIKGRKLGSFLKKYSMFIIPIIIISLFIIIYRYSNPVFNKLAGNIGEYFGNAFDRIFTNLDLSFLFTFMLGLLLSNFFLLRVTDKNIINDDLFASNDFRRNKRSFRIKFNVMGLKNECNIAVFLLITLNLLILVLNVIDVYWVWFNFEWEGQYLKQFVHEGTYLLILSIIISIALVLYYFRGNLNLYHHNKFLKRLSYVWLLQNAILTISVAIRNFWYIYYFALAYKRIGVIIFLILTIYGLYTVYIKVKDKKSTFYLLRTNAISFYVVLVFASIFNWDTIIAKYNFKHSDRSFVHLNYLSTLSNKSLPYLDKTMPELLFINTSQKARFPIERDYYMTPVDYYYTIDSRKASFKKSWEAKSIFEWNLPEYLAYKKLFVDTPVKP